MLTNCGLTIVGTLRSNKPHIPPEMNMKIRREADSSAFCFDNDITMVSYLPRTKKKLVLLPSIMHSQPTIDTNGKPEIINYYNKTKGAVDTFDQMCSMYFCSRKPRRWHLCLFYGIVNAATINSRIIYSKNKEGQQVKKQERRSLMQDLALQMVTPWAQKKSQHTKPKTEYQTGHSISAAG
ncbi:uncharacterized protein LOC121870531 [Homarus americanus]|uniref:PiggyBac transposable element-derived protein 4-like 17 n=1 Tax=Homarus americanus TaxID=6706 RepID=A0A8J5JZ99_HOMAM|nr:uncharacterized protein LOC121870531 [Homarus americanus]KAG7165311.1 PiggyBac transposable element-derived protein 4-like 17 [Homarus americanus]